MKQNKEDKNNDTADTEELKKGTAKDNQVLTDSDINKIKKESIKVLEEKKRLREADKRRVSLSDLGSPKMLLLILVAVIAIIVLLYAFFSIASTIFFQ